MHTHFYHWHTHAEAKPEVAILESRWNAAEKFGEEISNVDISSLLSLALFGEGEPEFIKKFSEFLVTEEPTFPPQGNTELLRVMATACLFSQMEESSLDGDAIALGIKAALFPVDRIQPICTEIITRAGEYLSEESESVRPNILVGSVAEPETSLDKLQTATNNKTLAVDAPGLKMLGDSLLEVSTAVKSLSEENQFLWWLVGRRSSSLNKRREVLTRSEYTLVAAVEASQRVSLLPPPASAESLLEEVINQCPPEKPARNNLLHFVEKGLAGLAESGIKQGTLTVLTPVCSLISARISGRKADAALAKHLRISFKHEVSAEEIAKQYFSELMFLRALTNV